LSLDSLPWTFILSRNYQKVQGSGTRLLSVKKRKRKRKVKNTFGMNYSSSGSHQANVFFTFLFLFLFLTDSKRVPEPCTF
jgi:hypothetical protein